MKKSLHILLAAALCLLIFCAACGKDGTIDNNTDKTPDNTPVTDPDTTPPDSTADDKQYDVTPPDSTADDKQSDTTPPDSTADDKQGDSNDAAAPAGDNNDPVEDSKPDDTQQTDDISVIKQYFPDDTAIEASRDVLRLYYEFLVGNTTAWDSIDTYEKTTIHDLPISSFALVDFGADGILEMVLKHNRYYCILYCDSGALFLDSVTLRGLGDLRCNGICFGSGGAAGVWEALTFSAEKGCQSQPIADYHYYNSSGEVYYAHSVYENDKYEPIERKQITKDEYDALLKPLDDIPLAVWVGFTDSNLERIFGGIAESTPLPDPVQPSTVRIEAYDSQALSAYYEFLTNGASVYDTESCRSVTFDSIKAQSDIPISGFRLVDLGTDGVREIILHTQNEDESDIILFYENGSLYADCLAKRTTYRCDGIGTIYGENTSGSIAYVGSCTAAEGYVEQTIASCSYGYDEQGAWNTEYYVYAVYEEGVFVPLDQPVQVSEFEYWDMTRLNLPDGWLYATHYYFTSENLKRVLLGIWE